MVERVLYSVFSFVCTDSNKISAAAVNCHRTSTSGICNSGATCLANVMCIKYFLSSSGRLKAVRRFLISGVRNSDFRPTAHNIFFGLKKVTDVNVRGFEGCAVFSELNVSRSFS